MSSSIFTENSSVPKIPDGCFDDSVYGSSSAPTANSNLVVVYGKNGMNFDRKGLENLIEEKTLSSISVIRLTSPTPSMEEEEAEAERLSAIKRNQDKGSDEDDLEESETSTNDETSSNDSDEDSDSNIRGSQSSDELHRSEEDAEKVTKRCKKKHLKKHKSRSRLEKGIRGKVTMERPEIVGLTVEEFYPPEDAKEMAKEILKLAGISTIRRTAHHELQLKFIKSDHCYTPFTSPAQMKAKLAAEKVDADKSKTIVRKIIPQNFGYMKQLLAKKKLQQGDLPKSTVVKPPAESEKVDQKIISDGKAAHNNKARKEGNTSFEHVDLDRFVETSSSGEEAVGFDESDFTDSEESVESENDRDSDLDFDVNNRNGRKRRVQNIQKAFKKNLASKGVFSKRNQGSNQEGYGDVTKPVVKESATVGRASNDNIARLMSKNSSNVRTLSGMSFRKVVAPPDKKMPNVIKKPFGSEKLMNPPHQHTALNSSVRRGPVVQVGRTPSRSSHLSAGKVPASSQTVKEIVINKVIASPKGGFTDIGALLSQPDIPAISTTSTPTSSTRSQAPQKTSTSPKGFMPLGIESAAKNQLPSQISIQTHQSSSELAAEHDKQLDLIDSIVKDEMEKSSTIMEKADENEDIPQLVKMLESTERALESNRRRQLNDFTSSSVMDTDIDISSAPLLETSEDEIPADLLQHVVELIEDDKTLQEAVEKEVFGDDSNLNVVDLPTDTALMTERTTFETNTESLSNTNRQLEKSSPSIIKPHTLPELHTKSIIQATLFSDARATTSSASLNASKTMPTVRKEPIQIVRGNGRVITLPPIEAPTTRAKRRAQKHPPQNANSSATDYLQTTPNDSFDTSIQSDTSYFSTDFTTPTNSVLEKKPTEAIGSARRRNYKEGNSASKVGRKGSGRKAVVKIVAAEDEDESHRDDDDPKKLWCICRQPHNNRFMICCDVCGDWFHGTCVNITKAMGTVMEQKGIDWTCPKCVKKLDDKKQRRITDMLQSKKAAAAEQLSARNVTANDATADITDSPVEKISPFAKQEVIPKKQIIDIKKIQSGQFISLKTLEEKNLTVITSDQKKQFSSLKTPAKTTTPILTEPRRVVVVQKGSAQKSNTSKKGLSSTKPPKSPVTADTIIIPCLPQSTTPCIVCRKPSRPNSIYCSDDCIRKHAQNALNAFTIKPSETPAPGSSTKVSTDEKKKKSKGLFEDLLSMADRKPKIERVNVFERKSGRYLSGNNAPTTANLKKWLQDNPTFEVVQPGSSQAKQIEKKQKQRSSQTSKTTPIPSPIDSFLDSEIVQPLAKNLPISNSSQMTVDGQTKETPIQQKALTHTNEPSKLSPTLSRPQTPKQSKNTQQSSTRLDKSQKSESKEESKAREKHHEKRQAHENSKKSVTSPTDGTVKTTHSEPIRVNVRRTLKEQLLLRINEQFSAADSETEGRKKPSVEYVEEFVKATELEMYNYFSRDIGAKYKAKYRSLMFNIKDRKNQSLFQKICAKVIKPKQLVRMSPEELASQELAQWRENETKHQLEMIKKSELDLLSCAKNYVLKTHKGEEVIEGKSTDCLNLDLTIPVEDVVSVLNNSIPSGNETTEGTISTTATRRDYLSSEAATSKGAQSYHVEADEHKSSNKEREREREKTHKNRDRHREKSKTKRRSRSRSRSHEKRHKSASHKDDKREREERVHERAKEQKDRSKDEQDKGYSEKKFSDVVSNAQQTRTSKQIPQIAREKHRDTNPTSTSVKKDTHTPVAAKSLEAFSLIDKILESTKTVEEAANIAVGKNKLVDAVQSTASANTVTTELTTYPTINTTSHNLVDSDYENKTNVSISSSPEDPYSTYYEYSSSLSLWKGNINMIDVASFEILIQTVIGNSLNMEKLFPEELDVVGRIGPDTVWEYISKIKKSPNKEIVVLRLLPASDSEIMAYTILYKYLHKRNRLGVIKTNSSQIKDFYIFPLVAGGQMPPILKPVERVEFFEDPYRPDILVGIVIRVIGKRLSAVQPQQLAKSTAKSSKFRTKPRNSDSFTPPGSPKRKRVSSNLQKDEIDIDAIIKAPIVAKKAIPLVVPTSTVVDDQDEPYSPGCSSDDDLPVKGKSAEEHKTAEEELKRKMDELNRQIAVQKMEIAGLLNVEPTFTPTPGTSCAPKVLNPSLANISIPSNLSQILASIKNKPETGIPPAVKGIQSGSVPPPPLIGSLLRSHTEDDDEYNPEEEIDASYMNAAKKNVKSSTSRLAQLSEAELLSMVPDDMFDTTTSSSQLPKFKKPRYDEPPPPGV